MEVGKRIRQARMAKNWTQKQLADYVELKPSTIAKYESGDIVNIKRSNLYKLATVLDLRGSDLIIDSDPIEAANLSAKILLDSDLMAALEVYYTLSPERQKMIRDLIRSFEK